VLLERLEEEFEEDHYDVSINDLSYRIYGPEIQDPAELWEVSTARTLDLINDLLTRAGSDERVYHLGGAEDGFAVFLTPAMVNLINGSDSLVESWIPAQPIG
jgi:hypothetical protein